MEVLDIANSNNYNLSDMVDPNIQNWEGNDKFKTTNVKGVVATCGLGEYIIPMSLLSVQVFW